MKKILLLSALLLVVSVSAEAKDLKIGLALPVSGPYAFAGKIVPSKPAFDTIDSYIPDAFV